MEGPFSSLGGHRWLQRLQLLHVGILGKGCFVDGLVARALQAAFSFDMRSLVNATSMQLVW